MVEHPNQNDNEDDYSPEVEDIKEVPKNLSACLHGTSSAGPERGRYITVVWPPVGGSGKRLELQNPSE